MFFGAFLLGKSREDQWPWEKRCLWHLQNAPDQSTYTNIEFLYFPMYPLVNSHITMENPRKSQKITIKPPCSMVFLGLSRFPVGFPMVIKDHTCRWGSSLVALQQEGLVRLATERYSLNPNSFLGLDRWLHGSYTVMLQCFITHVYLLIVYLC